MSRSPRRWHQRLEFTRAEAEAQFRLQHEQCSLDALAWHVLLAISLSFLVLQAQLRPIPPGACSSGPLGHERQLQPAASPPTAAKWIDAALFLTAGTWQQLFTSSYRQWRGGIIAAVILRPLVGTLWAATTAGSSPRTEAHILTSHAQSAMMPGVLVGLMAQAGLPSLLVQGLLLRTRLPWFFLVQLAAVLVQALAAPALCCLPLQQHSRMHTVFVALNTWLNTVPLPAVELGPGGSAGCRFCPAFLYTVLAVLGWLLPCWAALQADRAARQRWVLGDWRNAGMLTPREYAFYKRYNYWQACACFCSCLPLVGSVVWALAMMAVRC